MIRFVDLRPADIAGARFAFWDTVRDEFIKIQGATVWETWAEFLDYATSFVDVDFIIRLRGLCPEWVHEKPDDVAADQFREYVVVRRDGLTS